MAHPPPPEHLMQFIVYFKSLGLATRSMTVHMAALAFYARASGVADTTSNFRVRKMIDGIRRHFPPLAD